MFSALQAVLKDRCARRIRDLATLNQILIAIMQSVKRKIMQAAVRNDDQISILQLLVRVGQSIVRAVDSDES